ncbi:MAG: hypothetical protein LQ341_005383 [Variospora aurantia]|nr:MAG: hypothetical protein LQ341_005383 [Variospora aurantia]
MHYHFFLFSFFLTFALPSFAQDLDTDQFDPDYILADPASAQGDIRLSLQDADSGIGQTLVVGFHTLYLEAQPVKVRSITVADVAHVTGNNNANVPVTLRAKDIACQCYKDQFGTEPLGVWFSDDTGMERHGCTGGSFMSIFCSDARGLLGYSLFGLEPQTRR